MKKKKKWKKKKMMMKLMMKKKKMMKSLLEIQDENGRERQAPNASCRPEPWNGSGSCVGA